MRVPVHLSLLVSLAASLALSGCSRAEAWPQFRGPNQGHSKAVSVPLEWSEAKHVRWKTVLPGQGWSSPVTDRKQVWLTTAIEEGRSLHALCCDVDSGRLLLDVEVFRNEVVPPKHARNSYASPTPILDGDRVYVDFGEMGIACLATKDGRKLWENRELAVDHQNGPGGSAVLFQDLLLIACDGVNHQYGAAIDKATGKLRWKTVRSGIGNLFGQPSDHYKAYGTPIVFQLDGRPQSLTCAADRLYSYDPATGQEIWCLDYKGYSNVPTPVFDGKQIYVSSGFTKPEMIAIKASGLQGNVTASHVSWRQKTGAPDQSTPIVFGERLYMVSSGGIASCLNTATGEIVWKERIGPDYAASPIFAAGRLYFFDTAGKCKVIAPGDTFKVLAKNELPEGCFATPAVAGKALLVRTKTALYRIEE
jgi:outer membrane protein assembly factor BamB